MKIEKSIILAATTLVLNACSTTSTKTSETFSYRHPASAQELMDGSRKILADLDNPQIFNPTTCPDFVNKITDYMYNVPADHFIPKTPQEVEALKSHGGEVMDTIFKIRVNLHEKLQQFDSRNELSNKCILKVREGFQYARFAEEYLLDWLYSQNVYKFQNEPILTNKKPSTWTNSKFANFDLKSGDVMLIRGKSYVSAMIARIADEEGNFSHLAVVGEDKGGNKYVVEALIQYGVIFTPLEKWREAADARVALYRNPDTTLAQKAARVVYDVAHSAIEKGANIRYDFAMNDDDYSAWFCSETVRYAYDKASDGAVIVPKFRSTISKFKNTAYPRSLGVTKSTLFAPYDIEVDPRFDFVAEFRHYPLLRQVRMQDSVLQSIYDWMIKYDYTFHWDIRHSLKSYFAKFVRQFGVAADTLPPYMPLDSIKVNIQFQAVATALEQNLFAKEKEFYEKNGYLPSFQDMLKINEDYRLADCKWRRNGIHPKPDKNNPDLKKFHSFFHNEAERCEF
ncbi:MAG: YiiX/YebB-like N1pC/P60 family cysteine hydrolase [Pseudobdellovibrionaceae bacterium]